MKNILAPTILTVSTLALSFALLSNANAKKPDKGPDTASAPVIVEPTAGTATIDGNGSEWDTSYGSADFTATMCTAGSVNHETMECEGSGKENLSNLYSRYDCNNDILYVFVLEQNGYQAERSADNAWVTIGGNSNKEVNGSSGANGTPPDFAWVESDGQLLGYEASFNLAAGTHADVEVHLNVSGNTSSTGKTNTGGKISVSVPTDCDMPPVNGPQGDDGISGPQGDDDGIGGSDDGDAGPLLATDVDLTATLNGTQVDLTLTTSAEPGTAVLVILRGEKLSNGGTKVKPVCNFVSTGSTESGATYTCTDNSIGDTYRAIEIEYNGSLIIYDEVTL